LLWLTVAGVIVLGGGGCVLHTLSPPSSYHHTPTPLGNMLAHDASISLKNTEPIVCKIF